MIDWFHDAVDEVLKREGGRRFDGLPIGHKSNHLTVAALSFLRGRRRFVECRCDCGELVTVRHDHVSSGRIESCGCMKSAKLRAMFTKHGAAALGQKDRAYMAWQAMHYPCGHTEGYADRGSSVCARWSDYKSFLEDMGHPPIGLQLDRINNDGNYEPGNCRWATRDQQIMNRRCTVFIEWGGQRKPMRDWATDLSMSPRTLRNRLYAYKWSVEKALTEPVLVYKRKGQAYA